jgi:hypothetical protein
MIGLIDVDGKLTNLALMKISSYYKSLGEQVEFANGDPKRYEKVYASCLYTWNREKCMELLNVYGDKLIIGGTGWDFEEIEGKLIELSHTELPPYVEACKPDYDLYNIEMIYEKACKGGIATRDSKLKKAKTIIDMGIGFTSRGCIRSCGFCVVPKKEGVLRKDSSISDILNPRSNIITLYDNNLTADPDCLDKLHEIRDRKLKINISQGIDVRLLNEDKAKALGEVQHLRSLHYAWDQIGSEDKVIEGIQLLKQYVKPWRHLCLILTGYDTTFEEDMYRANKLLSLGVAPYVMKYNNHKDNKQQNAFASWINSRKHKACKFEEFTPWVNAQARM